MEMNKNKNCSIYEVVTLYALDKAFPVMGFINEYQLKNIENYLDGRWKYDIFSPKYRLAVEVSRPGAHRRKDKQRDSTKQNFSIENDVMLYHIRDYDCSQMALDNCIGFEESESTLLENVILSLKRPIQILIDRISIDFGISQQEFFFNQEEIDDLYFEISGKRYITAEMLMKMDVEEGANLLNCSVDFIKLVANKNGYTIGQAIKNLYNKRDNISTQTGIEYANEAAKKSGDNDINTMFYWYKDMSEKILAIERKYGVTDIELPHIRKNDKKRHSF